MEGSRTKKRTGFTQKQNIADLQKHEAGAKAGDLVSKHGLSDAT